MQLEGDFEQFLTDVQAPDARSIVTRPIFGGSLFASEIQRPTNFGPTRPIQYEKAYILQLRLQDCVNCAYFLAGSPLQVENRKAGASQFHDLREGLSLHWSCSKYER